MKLKKWQLWTIVGVTLGIAVGLIWWNLYATNKTAVTILLVIDFLIMTFSLQIAIQKTFKFKPKKKIYKTLEFPLSLDMLLVNLNNKGYKKRDIPFGYSFMKISNRIAYKVTFITDANKYLEDIEVKDDGNNPSLDKCKKFVGFEIFVDYNEKILERLPDFSFQGKNIYYEGFYLVKNEDKLIETNVIEPDDGYIDPVLSLKRDIGAVLENVDE